VQSAEKVASLSAQFEGSHWATHMPEYGEKPELQDTDVHALALHVSQVPSVVVYLVEQASQSGLPELGTKPELQDTDVHTLASHVSQAPLFVAYLVEQASQSGLPEFGTKPELHDTDVHTLASHVSQAPLFVVYSVEQALQIPTLHSVWSKYSVPDVHVGTLLGQKVTFTIRPCWCFAGKLAKAPVQLSASLSYAYTAVSSEDE